MSLEIIDCSGHGYWDSTNNKCRCYAGWTGVSCELQCTSGQYGIGCINVCTCGENASCDVFTGQCSCTNNSLPCVQCKSGLYGPTCSIACICGDGPCKSASGDCISDGASTNVGATAVAAITLGVILSVILIIILILMWALWRRKSFSKRCVTFEPDRENQVPDIEDTLNDFDIIYEVGSGRNSIDANVGSIASSNKMYPSRVVQHRELPGIPEEEEDAGGSPVAADKADENSLDRVEHWRFEKPLNSVDSVSSSVKAVHGSIRSNVDIHNEPKPKNASANPLSNDFNIGVDSTRLDCRIDDQLERALLSEDYMELRRSIENLTAAISHIPLVVSQVVGRSSDSLSLVGKSESSSDHEDFKFRSVPSINVSDHEDEMHVSGELESKHVKRKKKRASLHNYLAINTGNASTSSDDDDDRPGRVFDDAIGTAFNIESSGNESDSRGYNKVDRTKRSYSREIMDGNKYGSLQIDGASPSPVNQLHIPQNNRSPNNHTETESSGNYLETKSDRMEVDESEQKISQDDQYLEVKIYANEQCNASTSDTQYLETTPIKGESSEFSNNGKTENIELLENISPEVKTTHTYENKLGLTMQDEDDDSVTQDTTERPLIKTNMSSSTVPEYSRIRKISKAFTSEPMRMDNIQPITGPMKSKIPIKVDKQFSI